MGLCPFMGKNCFDCFGSGCAVWNTRRGCCSLVAIATELETLADKLSRGRP